jgi:hypothetical protein
MPVPVDLIREGLSTMTNEFLSDIFAWMGVIAPAILGLINVVRKATRFAIIAPILIALITGASLYFRNVVSAEKDMAITRLRAQSLAFQQYAGPRSINEQAFNKALAGAPKGRVEIVLLSHVFDGEPLANTLARLLKAADWSVTVRSPENTSEQDLLSIAGEPAVRAVLIRFSEQSPDAPKLGKGYAGSLGALVNAIPSSGIQSNGMLRADPQLPPDLIRIIIGQKDPKQ